MKTLITPEHAGVLLKANPMNRQLKPKVVNALVSAINRNEFVYNGESIIVSKDGHLMDGQHRLAAIEKSGIACECELIHGVDKTAMTTIDTGTARTSGDNLGIQGYQNSNALGAMVRTILVFNKKSVSARNAGEKSGTYVTNTQIVEYVKNNESVQDYLIKERVAGLSGSDLSFVNYVVKSINNDRGETFINQLITGEMLKHDMPVYTLRTILFKDYQRPKCKYNKRERFAFVFRAFDKFMKNETGKRLNGIVKGVFPYPKNYPFYD